MGLNDTFKGLQDISLGTSTDIPMGPITISPFLIAVYAIQANLSGIHLGSVNSSKFEVYGGFSATLGF